MHLVLAALRLRATGATRFIACERKLAGRAHFTFSVATGMRPSRKLALAGYIIAECGFTTDWKRSTTDHSQTAAENTFRP